MTLTRRRFLRSGAITVVLTGLALDSVPLAFAKNAKKQKKSDPSRDFKVPPQVKRDPILYFKRETFEPYLNGVFQLSAGRSLVDATLISIRDYTPGTAGEVTPNSRPTESFALVFKARETLTDLTTIYNVEHGALGSFALFLTYRAGETGEDGQPHEHFYEAVFNRPL